MTPEQYVQNQILEYPSLYACSSFEESFFRVFDHMFNTIGSGNNIDILDRIIKFNLVLNENDIELLEKYTTTDDFAYGYTEDQVEYYDGFAMPKTEAGIEVCQSDMHKYPHIIHWCEFSSDHRNIMYPNFKKGYSLCWQDGIVNILNKEWLQAVIKYYEKCLHVFETSENIVEHYSAAEYGGQAEITRAKMFIEETLQMLRNNLK